MSKKFTLSEALAQIDDASDELDDVRAHRIDEPFIRLRLYDVRTLFRGLQNAMTDVTLEQTDDPIYQDVYRLVEQLGGAVDKLDNAVECGTLGVSYPDQVAQ